MPCTRALLPVESDGMTTASTEPNHTTHMAITDPTESAQQEVAPAQARAGDMTVAQAMIRSLESAGVEYIFGMSGHANLALLDAIAESQITFVSVPHEQIAVHAADGYFRASRRVGVVLTTLGPGLSNTVGGLADAIQDCSAVLILAANAAASTSGQDDYQEMAAGGLGQTDLLRPVTKQTWRVTGPHQALPLLARAYSCALASPSGPAMLDLPMDVMSMVDTFKVPDLDARRAVTRPAARAPDVSRAVAILAAARRPAIFCGGGALLSEASESVQMLAETFEAPVVTTLIAQGIMPNAHRLFAGVSGAVGTRPAHFVTANADVIVVVGSRLSDIDANSLHPDYFGNPPETAIIQIDVDPRRIGSRLPVSVGLVADADTALRQLVEAAESASATHSVDPAWISEFHKCEAAWQEELNLAQGSDESPPCTEAVLRALHEALPSDVQMIAGIGPRYLVAQHFPIVEPGSHYCASGNGTMGWAVPGALGVKLARPDKAVVCVCGDGEMRAVCSTLSTNREYDVPVIYVVLNNYSYNVIELYQHKYYGRTLGSVFTTPDGELYSPDYAKLAEAYGIRGVRATSLAEMLDAVNAAAREGVSLVVDLDSPRRPRLRASGYWDVNRYLEAGWNLPGNDVVVGGFGDSDSSASPRRTWTTG